MSASPDINVNLLYASLYIAVLGTVTAVTYQKLKLLTHRGEVRRRNDPELASMPRAPDWRDILFPLLIGAVYVGLFAPITVFTWLPFSSRWVETDILLAALLVSQGANGGYESARGLAEFLAGLIGRISSWR